jgi:glycogen(starch) synthase
MRIWLLTSELPQEIAGGIARYVDNFARLLGVAGHEVVVIARTEQACDKPMAPGVRLIGIVPRYDQLNASNPSDLPDTHLAYPYNVLAYWPALSYQMAAEVLRLLQHLPLPDIIESQEYAALPYYLLQRKLTEQTALESVPILVQLHSPTFELARLNQEPRYRFPEYWVGQMEKFCIVAADALLSPSAFLARRMEETLQRSLDITRIPYPLVFPSDLTSRQVEARQIVYVGRLELRKGVLPLVKACSRLWSTSVDFQLTLIGGDVEFLPKETTVGTFLRQRYARWIDSGHLKLAGQVEQARVFEHLQRAWAVVVPSLWENFPNTCMEAMGAGQVVLASQTGGQAEMIEANGTNGFLFDWRTSGDFEQKLLSVLALDEAERRQIGRRAQTCIRALCAPEVVLPQRIRHYEAVLERASPRSLFPTVASTFATRPGADPQTATRFSPMDEGQAGLLSIVIPYYNLGEYVGEALASVLATTYTSCEVLIVNDGSTEAQSLAVLREIEERGLAHVRIMHAENQGLATTRNTGAEAARGEFLAFVDADDVVESEFFAKAIAVLSRYPNVAFVYSWVRYFGEAKNIWPTWNAEFPYLLGHNMLTPLVVTRRAAFLRWARNQVEFEYNFEDFDSWVAFVEAGGIGVSLPQPLVRYRVRAGSMYRSSNRSQQLYLYDLLTQRHPECYREWGVEVFNLQNANGPGWLWNHPASDGAEPPAAYLAVLEEERRKLSTEVQTLGRAWADHIRFIEAQRAYIEGLEARCRELLTTGSGNGGWPLTSANGVLLSDYEIGGRLMSRMRRTWLARRILRIPGLKEVVKKTLRR